MEYCPRGDLDAYLRRKVFLSTPEAQNLAGQILEGLARMHANGFAHRDLKPAVSR